MTTQDELLAQCAPSYPAMFRERVDSNPDGTAFLVPSRDEQSPTTWAELSWAQSRARVDRLAAGLMSLGLGVGQCVAIASSTRIEWVLGDLAIASAGAVTTTIYSSTNVEDFDFILTDSSSVMLLAENWEQAAKALRDGELVGALKRIILIDDDRPAGAVQGEWLLTWAQLDEFGRDYLVEHPSAVNEAVAALTPDSLSSIIYTSGTTGQSKGVELVQRCWCYEGVAIRSWDAIHEDDLLYLWLPLAHVFGRDLLSIQLAVGFCAAVDGRVDRIMRGLSEVHPTILVGVPRIFEKVRNAVITMNPKDGLKGRISRWAFAVGRDSRDYRLRGDPLPKSLEFRYRLADKLVFSKLKDKLGGRMRFMVSGSAKLSRQVQEWFYSAGITLVEGYGLTECSAVAFLNLPDRPRFGSVGMPLPGMDARLAEDGEVLLRGPNITRGYAGLAEETAEAFEGGWFRTGDIGQFDDGGNLVITDRKKDLMKTSNGKYVAPQKVEGAIVANIPYVSQAVAVGEGHKFVVALVALDPDNLAKWGRNHGHPDASYQELAAMPEIRTSIDRFMRKANTHLEGWEQVKKYAILARELSQNSDELTPNMKVRRNVVLTHYENLIIDLYESPNYPFLEVKAGKKQ